MMPGVALAVMAALVVTLEALPVTSRTRSPQNTMSNNGAAPAAMEDFALDLDTLAKLGISPEMIQKMRDLASRRNGCDQSGDHGNSIGQDELRRYFLHNRTVTCNDGSRAGYYLRESHTSDRWMIFLEGGWYCFDEASCHGRWINTPQLMSSTRWPERRTGSGILSGQESENPYLHDATIVYVPYCSSDSWSGTYKANGRSDFSFMGSLILEEVVKQLVKDHSLRDAKMLLIAGSSAGGTGVLLNLDHLAGVMGRLAPRVEVRGIADSGWFLDNHQYKRVECTDAHLCAPTEGIQRGINLWHGRVPTTCGATYSGEERWRCYFGYRIYPTLKTPVFVVQHLFDEAQITADNVGAPVKKEQWQYIHNMGKDMKQTLSNVSAVFAPACLSHITLTRSEWQRVAIDGVTLPQALRCWEMSRKETNHYPSSGRHSNAYLVHQLITGQHSPRAGRQKYLNDEAIKSKRQRRKHKKKKNRSRKRKRHKGRGKEKRQRERQRQRPRPGGRPRRSLWFDQHDMHHMRYHDNQCSHHRLDHCAWPQCNLSCPKIHNPFTGEELDFIDLLLQFGLDLSSIANALGMDLPTLQTMDHDLLLQMLTQS